MSDNNIYRHELKYLINHCDLALTRQRINGIMKRDEHTVNGIYKIRSLYFDDYWNTSFTDKIMGVNNRKKYRIRFYNDDDRFIRLERKSKVENYICKVSTPITREEAELIIDGRYAFLLKKDNDLCRDVYYQCVSRVMRPCVIVEYEREAFVHLAGDTRVTFDTNVRASTMFKEFFTPLLPFSYMFEEGNLVMEVKFTELLSKIIRNAIPCKSNEYSAVSKFTGCFEKTSSFIPLTFNGATQI